MPSASSPALVLPVLALTARLVAHAQDPPFQCQKITIPMCRSVGYNVTHMPNRFHHDTQEEAGLEVHQYWPLVEIGCSEDLQFFLCATYVPICVQQLQRVLPVCRSVCERAKAGCQGIMAGHRFAWPARLDCSVLPQYGDSQRLCMDNKNGESPAPRRLPGCECTCGRHNTVPLTPTHQLFNMSVSVAAVAGCARPCRSPHFSTAQHQLTEKWVFSWAVLCATSSLLTVATFLIDRSRFQYPERPIIFLAGCYFMVSLGYLVRMGAGHDFTACDGGVIRYPGTGPPTDAAAAAICTIVFTLVYYFGMASAVWWVILSLTWFLAAGLKWGTEVITGYSPYFHLAAWVMPAVKTIAALATSAVDGDSLTGLCYVGNQDLDNLRWFVLVPLVAYLLLGTSFLMAGFVSLFRIRSVIKQDRGNRDKLEKLMMRIGIYSVLYTVPASTVIGCLVYEYHQRADWDASLVCPCHSGGKAASSKELVQTSSRSSSAGTLAAGDGGVTAAKPNFQLFLLRHFMSLAVGVTSIIWVWSRKTLRSWRRLILCRTPSPEGQTLPAAVPAQPPPGGQEEPPPLPQPQPTSSHTTSHTLSEPQPALSQKSLPLSHV